MAYTLWWPAVVRHQPFYWATPADFWGRFRDAHLVSWGYISQVYNTGPPLVTLPGYAVLLAPVAVLSSALGLWESAPQAFLPKPSAWLLAGPFVLLAAGVALFALDSLARRLGVTGPRRVVLLTAEAVLVWPAVAMWGHPEDVLALAVAAFALTAAADRACARAGWLMGAAIALQLFAVLLVPVLIGMAGARRRLPLLLRSAVLPAFFLAAVLVPDFHDAWRALTRQPGYPTANHPTPWVLLSPGLGHHMVAAGPARIGAVVLAFGAGGLANFWRPNLGRLVWLAAVVMTGRCLFEAVMVPYYVMPALALALIAGVHESQWRWLGAVAASSGVTVLTFWHANMWIYWLEMTALLATVLILTFPRRPGTSRLPRVAFVYDS
jgi:hypothetical protein